MNENDKILITAYFDNEVSIDEKKYVELLLSEDVDAIEYSNAIKLSNNQIDNFFSSDEINALRNSISDFTKDIQETSKKGNTISKLKESILHALSSIRMTSSFAVVILFSIIIIPLFNNEEVDTLYEFNIPIERSESILSVNILIEETVYKMKDLSLNKSKLIIGDSSIIITITKEDKNCILGNATLIKSSKTREFEYCLD